MGAGSSSSAAESKQKMITKVPKMIDEKTAIPIKKAITSFSGQAISSISVSLEDRKITVEGDFDALLIINSVKKVRKLGQMAYVESLTPIKSSVTPTAIISGCSIQ